MSRLGLADLGLASLPDMVTNASMLSCLSPTTPLIADADTGYGGPIAVSRTVTTYARAGVAGLHIEDQVVSKRCGHLMGKEVVSREDWRARIRAACLARDACAVGEERIVVIARTDARQGLGFEEAVERLRIAVEEGVDAVFPEAMQSQDECKRMCEIFSGKEGGREVPVLLNVVPKGATPSLSVEEAKKLGFRIMIFPVLGLEGAIKGMRESMGAMKETGTQDPAQCVGVREMFRLCALDQCMEIDAKAGGKAFRGV
jgi:2-methylisocitrate lyase-like PEP mutase family enzyme